MISSCLHAVRGTTRRLRPQCEPHDDHSQAPPELAIFIAIVLGFAIGRVRHRREHMVALTRIRL
jgi:hypothetical protein